MSPSRRALVVAAACLLLISCTSATPSPKPSGLVSPEPSASSIATSLASQSPGPTQTSEATPASPATSAAPPPTDSASATPPAETSSPSPTVAPTATSVFPSAAPGSIVVPVASGYSDLTFVTNSGDGSNDLYVVEQSGRAYRLAPGQSAPGDLILDISGQISAGGEQGLLGLAFHPDFASNRRFFVDFTDQNGDSVIAELTMSRDGTPEPGVERVLNVNQPFSNHNGGMLAFGPDGYLYVGFGDGGSAGDPHGNGQNIQSLLGKILRIDVDSGDSYGIPADNPFADGTNGARPEIWDWGMRNPWRFSFDRESGGLFIGDVGQDQWEEVDVESAGLGGRNYGWNVMEGTHCYGRDQCNETGLTLPVLDYAHRDGGCTVIGGYVYRGTRFPELVGQYFYADYCSGTVWSFDAAAALAGTAVTPTVFGHVPFLVSSFGEDEAGELYIVDAGGAVYALVEPG